MYFVFHRSPDVSTGYALSPKLEGVAWSERRDGAHDTALIVKHPLNLDRAYPEPWLRPHEELGTGRSKKIKTVFFVDLRKTLTCSSKSARLDVPRS